MGCYSSKAAAAVAVRRAQEESDSYVAALKKLKEEKNNHEKYQEKLKCAIDNLKYNSVMAGYSYDYSPEEDTSGLQQSSKDVQKTLEEYDEAITEMEVKVEESALALKAANDANNAITCPCGSCVECTPPVPVVTTRAPR